MKKEADKTEPIENQFKKKVKLILLGSLLFLIVAVITFSIIFYSAYFFSTLLLKILFRIVIAMMGILAYYILIDEFIRLYDKRVEV